MDMLHKVFIKIYNLLPGTKDSFMYRVLFFLLIVSPIVVLALINYASLDKEITKSILAERRSLSVLASATIHENLDSLVNLGISYATRPRLIENIEKGNWQGALDLTAQALDFFPFFDRIVLYDPQGVIKADLPHALPNVIGQSRADREWFNGVKRNWNPYISGIYIRGAEPKTPVVSVIVPIKTMSSLSKAVKPAVREDRKVIGILQFQVKLDIFNHWINRIDIGPGSIIYIVDQYGRIVYHPRYAQTKTITDFSSIGIVAKVMQGIGGAEVNYNPVEKEERLAAYEPLSLYGWGVVITQPVGLAYLEKNAQLKNVIITYSIVVLLAGAIALLLLYNMAITRRAEKALKESELRYRTVADFSSDWEYWIMPDGTFRHISINCQNITGYTPEEFLADKQLLRRVIHPDDWELYTSHIHQLSAEGVPQPLDYRICTKGGEYRWISHVCRPVYDSTGKANGERVSNRDITDRKQAEKEREMLISELQKALSEIKALSGMIPICASCKKIRDDKGYWNQIESYIKDHSEAQFSHSICPDCVKKLYPEVYEKMYKNKED